MTSPPTDPQPAPADPPLLALAMVIRDEQRFLAEHLAYHRRLGVDRFYLFLDRCTDATPQIAAAQPAAVVLHRDRRDDETHMSVFQTRCLAEALDLARADGVAWLLHLDADEFARGHDPYRRRLPRPRGHRTTDRDLARAALPRLFADLPGHIQQVVLRPLDTLPTPAPPGTPFYHHEHFQHRGAIRRRILDPATGQTVDFRKRLGHYHGKAAVRVGPDVQPHNAHRWAHRDGSDLPTAHRGVLYHFIAVDAELWHLKHQKFAEYPAHWEKGNPVRFPKQAWKEATPRMSPAQAADYFNRYVALPPARLARHRLTGNVVSDDFVRHLITSAHPIQPPRGHA